MAPELPFPSNAKLMVYDATSLREEPTETFEEALRLILAPPTGWLHLERIEPGMEDVLENLVGLHPLAIEDASNDRQRSKVESYGDHDYVVIRALGRARRHHTESHQLNFFMGEGWLLSIGEWPDRLYDGVRARIRSGRKRIRSHGSDYLAYALIDAAVDTYAPLLDESSEVLEALEDLLLDDAPSDADVLDGLEVAKEDDVLSYIHAIRRDLRRKRRDILPAREAVGTLLRDAEARQQEALTAGSGVTLQPGTKDAGPPPDVYLRDVHDHVIQAIDRTESQREAAASLLELHLTLMSHRTNEVMRVLTIVATIFIPLGFVAGVYGMNFDTAHPWNMPELGLRYGYVGVLTFMAVVGFGMVAFFRRKGWM